MIGDICVHQRKKHLLNFEAEIVCYFIECVYKVFFFLLSFGFYFIITTIPSPYFPMVARVCVYESKKEFQGYLSISYVRIRISGNVYPIVWYEQMQQMILLRTFLYIFTFFPFGCVCVANFVNGKKVTENQFSDMDNQLFSLNGEKKGIKTSIKLRGEIILWKLRMNSNFLFSFVVFRSNIRSLSHIFFSIPSTNYTNEHFTKICFLSVWFQCIYKHFGSGSKRKWTICVARQNKIPKQNEKKKNFCWKWSF